jgi:hypothetical protein
MADKMSRMRRTGQGGMVHTISLGDLTTIGTANPLSLIFEIDIGLRDHGSSPNLAYERTMMRTSITVVNFSPTVMLLQST